MILSFFQKTSRNWGSKVFFSVLDQGIFSGSNFLATFFLGRWLSEVEYGVFSIVFVIFLFLSGFYNSLIFEPMMVFGSNYTHGNLEGYLRKLLSVTLKSYGFSIIGIIVLVFLDQVLVINHRFIPTFIGMFMSMPLMMCFWLARQATYIGSTPEKSILGDMVYCVVLMGGLYLALKLELLTSFLVFITMGLASLLAFPFITIRLGIKMDLLFHLNIWPDRNEIVQHWRYGKWAMLASIAYGASTLAFTPIIGLILGLEQAGLFRAVQNLMAPIAQVNTAFTTLLIPWTARQRIDSGNLILRKRFVEFLGLFLAMSCFYLIPVNIFASQLMNFYSKEYYSESVWIVPVFSIIMVLSAALNPFGIIYRALEKPKLILESKVVSAVIVLTVCIFLTAQFQITGLLIGMALSVIGELIILFFHWKTVNR